MGGGGLTQPIVTLSEAQAYVRIETGEEEAILAGLIRTASAICESFLNQAVILRDFVLELRASRRSSPSSGRGAGRRSDFASVIHSITVPTG